MAIEFLWQMAGELDLWLEFGNGLRRGRQGRLIYAKAQI
jgi:hypothetical protein